MRVQQVQPNLNFEAKRRYIDIDSLKNLRHILREMDKDTVYQEHDGTFESTKTTRIEYFDRYKEKQAELIDLRGNLKKLDEGRDMYQETVLKVGKTQVSIDNRTGEIKSWEKPFFSTWSGIMKKISFALIDFDVFYNNASRVKKHRFSIEGFTKKGYETLQKILKAK